MGKLPNGITELWSTNAFLADADQGVGGGFELHSASPLPAFGRPGSSPGQALFPMGEGLDPETPAFVVSAFPRRGKVPNGRKGGALSAFA